MPSINHKSFFCAKRCINRYLKARHKWYPIKFITLGEGEAFENNVATVPSLKVSKLVDGALLDGGKINLDEEAIERFGLTPLNTQIIEDDSDMYYINKQPSAFTRQKIGYCLWQLND